MVVGRVAAVRIEWLAVAARDATRGFEVCVAAWLRLACANVHFGRVRACGWLGGWLAGWLAGCVRGTALVFGTVDGVVVRGGGKKLVNGAVCHV